MARSNKGYESTFDKCFPREIGMLFPCDITEYLKLLQEEQVKEFIKGLYEIGKGNAIPDNLSNIVKMLLMHLICFDDLLRKIKAYEEQLG